MELLHECLFLRAELKLPNVFHLQRLRQLQDGTQPWTVQDELFFLLDRKYIYDFAIQELSISQIPTGARKPAPKCEKPEQNVDSYKTFECAKCGRGPFKRTDGVRKHARRSHGDWVLLLTPSEFARPCKGEASKHPIVRGDDCIPIAVCEESIDADIPIAACDDIFAEIMNE